MNEKKTVFIIIILLLTILVVMPSSLITGNVDNYSPTESTEIWFIDDLYAVRYNLSGDYILMKDLDFQNNDDYVNWSVSKAENTTGSGWLPIGVYLTSYFNGTFDGQGHTISNLFISSALSNVGLFGAINCSEISDLGLINVAITGTGTDPNTYHRGALVGIALGTNITKCYATGNITSAAVVGGLVGYQYLSIINQSYTIVKITCSATSVQSLLGGLVGVSYNSIIEDTYARGGLTGVGGRSPSRVGGLIGHLVRDSSGPGYAGKYTKNSYATGAVAGTAGSIGGLVGLIYNPTFVGCYWDTQTTGQAGAYGTTGSVGSGSGTYGKTTVQMYQQSTFVGWVFPDTWVIDEGIDYPHFGGESPTNDSPNILELWLPLNNSDYESVYNCYLKTNVTDPDGDPMDVSFYWGNGSLIGTIHNATNGTCNLSIADFLEPSWKDWLDHNTTYTWYVNVTDGEYVVRSNETFNFHTSYAWDCNEDRLVDYLDISMVVSNYRLSGFLPGEIPDIVEDGVVNYLDISSLVSHYRENYT